MSRASLIAVKIPSNYNWGKVLSLKSPRWLLRYSSTSGSAAGFTDYESERKTFKLDVPEYYNFATDVIDSWAEKEKQNTCGRNGNPAFWWIDECGNELQWNFNELSVNSKRTANVLMNGCGMRAGDRVLVVLPRVPEWWLINIACIRLGVILIPGTTQLTSRDIRHRLLKSGCSAIITDPSTAEKVDQVVADCPKVSSKVLVGGSSEDRAGWYNFQKLYSKESDQHQAIKTRSDEPMTIFFTSGTTGEPKMTEHTHVSFGLASVITGRYWLDLVPSDVHWNLSDTGWAKSAWSNLFAPWLRGSCVFIQNSPKFDTKSVLQVFCRYPVTTFCSAPTAYRMFVQEDLTKYKFQSLRHCVSAGEPLNPEVIETWQRGTGMVIREGYGQTETVLQAASYHCIPNKPGSMGKPAPGMDVRVIDDCGEEMAEGQEGDLAIKVKPHRPVGLFTRYVDEPEKTAAAFRGDYYVTGDRAYRDADGYLWFVSRADDVILSAGYRIGPFEVESALIEHPAVAESAVISSPDPVRGEVVKAFVVLTDKYKDVDKASLVTELQEHTKETTAPYKYPRKIEFVDSLPKTVSGKIRRVELREAEWAKK